MKDTKEKDTSVAELTSEDYQKILTILQQIGKITMYTPAVYDDEIKPLMAKVQPLTQ